jgi:hypothetical protein
MRRPQTLPVLVMILSAFVVGSTSTATQAVRAAAFSVGLPCSVTVADRPGDAIQSDGGGPYVDGVSGIDCTVYQGASDDVTFYLTASGKKGVRYLQFDYTDKISGSGPTGVLNDHSAQSSFQTIAAIGVGSTAWHTGGFTTSIGRFAFNPANWPGASLLSVTRMSANDWSVTADGGVNDVAVLSQTVKKGTIDVGHYHMAFQMLVHCESCS